MDPNTVLARLRYMAKVAGGGNPLTEHGVEEFLQRFRDLDSWLSQGGFPPEEWREGPDVYPEHIYVPERDDDVPEINGVPVLVPADFEVQPLDEGERAGVVATCGECGLSWDDSIPTAYTPAPSGRCPFEAFHSD